MARQCYEIEIKFKKEEAMTTRHSRVPFLALLVGTMVSVTSLAAVESQTDYPSTVEQALSDWPEETFNAAQTIIDKYGMPDEVSQSQLTWYNTGLWKRTILSKEPIPHHFPVPHLDYVEQVIDYKVPPNKFDDLALYDGSVIAERTKGELSARCHMEAANILAINLAHDIIADNKTVAQAREAFAEAIVQSRTGEMPMAMKEFTFSKPLGNTADPDITTIED